MNPRSIGVTATEFPYWRRGADRISWAVLCLAVLALLAVSVPASAARRVDFNIARQRADEALVEFARQAGISVLLPAAQISQVTTNTLQGNYALEDALAILLRDTGLVGQLSATGTLTVRHKNDEGESGMQSNNKKWFGKFIALVAAGLAILGSAAGADGPAQETSTTELGSLDEVVVTAQRRSEKMVDVPISITAISAAQLATANVQDLSDIQQITPALRFDTQSGFFQPSIRGIGTNITTSGGGSNVGIYVDGFYSPNPLAADFQLMDVTNIQVLKGPQGTLFGHNTTGGAILVTTAEPSTDPHAEAKVSYGSFNAQRYQLYGTTGLTDRVAVDVEGLLSKGNGFVTNIVDDDNHVGAYDNWTVRGGLKVEFSDKLSALLRYTHSEVNDPSPVMTNSNTDTTIDPTTGKPWGIQTPTPPGLYTTNPNQVAEFLPPISTVDSDIAQLTIKADLDFANLTSYSQYRQENENLSTSANITGVPIFQEGLPVADLTFSQEFLLASKPGPRLQWTGGFFFFSNRDDYTIFVDNDIETTGRIHLGANGTVTQSYAGYFDSTYELTPQLFLTAGLRYSHDLVKDAYYEQYYTNTEIPVPGISSNKVTPRAVLRYKPTDESSIYASYTEGYKAAIIDVGGSCSNGPAYICNPVKPEDVHAFEVGYKLESHRLSNEVAAFYDDYKNLQVTVKYLATQAYILNAAQSKIYGLEDELHFNVAEHVDVNAGGAWTHARYETFGTTLPGGGVVGAPIYASCPANPATLPPVYASSCGPGTFAYEITDTIVHDTPLTHSPDYTATLGARYTTGMLDSGEYATSGNLYYSSKFYFSPSGTQFLQPSYTTLNLRAQWTHPSEKYTAALYVDNVTNERYRLQVQQGIYGFGAEWSPPVTWGVELGAKFR